jgi:hypothetical protein
MGMRKSDELQEAFPQYKIPDILIPGQVYNFGTSKKYKIGQDFGVEQVTE